MPPTFSSPMAEHPPMRHTVALQGFSAFERRTLASFFRLAAEREPTYEQTELLGDCDLVLADADRPDAVEAVRRAERVGDTVFIGALSPPGAGASLPRPIDPARLLRALDGLVARVPPTPAVDPMLADAAQPPHHVLVVDDSRVALRFLQLRLERQGFRAHLAATADAAADRLQRQRFEIVFVDIALARDGRQDGLTLCQHIKQRVRFDGHTPAVVVVNGHASPTDRVRGSLAGCDAYLVKPLLDDALNKVLRDLRTSPTRG